MNWPSPNVLGKAYDALCGRFGGQQSIEEEVVGFLLLETGDAILLESGDKILIE